MDAGADGGCAISAGLTLYCWVPITPDHVPTRMPGAGWLTISVGFGGQHHCGIALGALPGSLTPARHCWGLNIHGAVGDGTRLARSTPRRIDDGRWVTVNAGASHTCGISTGGYLYCWGANYHAQLGIGSDLETVDEPVRVSG